MNPRDIIRARLVAVSAVTNLVSTRIYPGYMPQDATLPAIVLQTVSNVPEHSMDGHCGLTVARVQVTIIATTASGAEAVREQVRLAMDGFGPGAVGSARVQQITRTDGGSIPDASPGNEVQRTFGERDDYLIAYEETIPSL